MEPAKKGKLYVVGVGPGSHDHMTYRAKQVIEESEIIVGYETYVGLVEDLIQGKEVYRYAMTQEVDRANQAIGFAEKGKIVSLVSSHPFSARISYIRPTMP
jgi:precorrin-3B C17-methyltransferase